jgi:hypothetical protein
MKKTLVTIAAAVAVVASSYAQGTVTFANLASSLVTRQTSALNSTPISMQVGGGHVELLWAPSGTTDLGLFQPALTLATANTTANGITDFHTAPGRFSGGAATVNTAVAGGGVALYLRGWTGNSATYAEAQALFIGGTEAIGQTPIWTLASTGNPTLIPPGAPAALGSPALLLSYNIIPEPSSMVLAGLGAASLLMFRRKK